MTSDFNLVQFLLNLDQNLKLYRGEEEIVVMIVIVIFEATHWAWNSNSNSMDWRQQQQVMKNLIFPLLCKLQSASDRFQPPMHTVLKYDF